MTSSLQRPIVRDFGLSNIRYITDDHLMRGERIYFAQGNYNQNVMVIPKTAFRGRHLFFPKPMTVEEIIEGLNDLTGLDIPEGFYRGLNVHLIPALLMQGGISVPSRVLRQQIFIGGMPTPFTEEMLHVTLFHALGNALWNYLDYRVWGARSEEDEDTERDYAEKNEYRTLRDFPYHQGTQANNRQRDLFYVAAEDFRCLFGTPLAGRGEWYLDGELVKQPNPEVSNFWRRELKRNGSYERAAS